MYLYWHITNWVFPITTLILVHLEVTAAILPPMLVHLEIIAAPFYDGIMVR